MLLTLPPVAERLTFIQPYDHRPFEQPFSSPLLAFDGHFIPVSQVEKHTRMSTPHRGLPLPGPMALSDQHRAPLAHPPSQPLGYAPLPAQHPHGREEERHDWYWAARAEEDKRKQEEEKTRQEEIKLEQLRVEREMLRESMEAGVPPHLLPMIFAAIGGGSGSSAALEMVQQYMAQVQQQNQQHTVQATTHMSPELRRDTRNMTHPQHTAFPQPTPGSQAAAGHSAPPNAMNAATVYPSPAYHSPAVRSRAMVSGSNGFPTPGSVPKPPAPAALPRLTTNEAMIQQPPSALPAYGPSHQDRASPSPSIYFHHWQPPATQNPSPATKDPAKTSPNQPSQLSSSSTQDNNSPRKRKAQGPHQPNPPPSSAQKTSSPSMSEKSFTSRRGGHARQSSDGTSRGYDPVGRANRQISRRSSSQEESKFSNKPSPPDRRISQEPRQATRTESSKSET